MLCAPTARVLVVLLTVLAASHVSLDAARRQSTRQVPVESLIYDLKNPDPVRRREAVVQLGINKVQRATPDLVALATDPDVSVRRALAVTLVQVADARSLPGFVTLTSDAERDIRQQAIEALTNLYLPQESGLVVTLNRVANFFNPWSDEWGEVVVEPDLVVDPSAIAAVSARLQDAEAGVRARAARSLGILRARTAAPGLLAVLRDDRSDDARFEAVRALRKIGDRSVAPALVPLIPINAPRVRNEVVFTIGRLREESALPELRRLLDKELIAAPRDMDRAFALHLLDAIAVIGSPGSKSLLLSLQQSADADLRLHAVEGLARLADHASPQEVTAMAAAKLAEQDARVRLAQAFALYRMGREEHLVELVNALGSRRTNDQARSYLLELQPAEVGDLVGHAGHTDVNVVEAIAEILGHVGNASTLPTLHRLLQDTRGQVSALAAQAIRRIEART
jgi:HEAT repeat protein